MALWYHLSHTFLGNIVKVKIGKYINWFGVYQLADLLKYVGVGEERISIIQEYLSETWLVDFFEWIHNKKHRNIKIHIDDYDVWGMDHTLSLIILPMLIKLKAAKHGAPLVDDEDVPPELRSTVEPPAPDDENYGAVDGKHFERWDWIMDEMIWAFNEIAEGTDPHIDGLGHENWQAHYNRVLNGTTLFGKYYRGLWD